MVLFSMLLKVVLMLTILTKFHHADFELKVHKAIIRGVYSRSHCCYANMLCYKNDNNLFTNNWSVF